MAGNVVRQAGEQSSRLITKCTWHRDKIVSWRLWGVYQRAERMNIQRLQPLKGEKNILRFKSWRVWFKSASLGLCATGSGLTTTSTTDTGFIFFLLLSRVDFKPILFMRHISHLKAAQRDLQTTQTKKKHNKNLKKAGREMQIDLKQEDKPTNTFHIREKKRTLAWI